MNQDSLLPSLSRVVRGLSALFWGLPLALLACTRTALGDLWSQWGLGLPVASCGLVWFGLRQLEGFRPRERVWVQSVRRAELLALLNLALSPFTWWWSRRPEVAFFGASLLLMLFSAMIFLLALNQSLRRLAALLPDETLRSDIRLFTGVNGGLLGTLLIFAAAWTLARDFPLTPAGGGDLLDLLEQARVSLIVSLGLPPVALTMALVWKAKEAIVMDVYRDHRDAPPAGLS
ncbi:MAG: hypothetical protein FJ396_10990 [Verrucomicrobia bacterium]|nr:hypothetical protein [Verrucomicrobiota bacterium]